MLLFRSSLSSSGGEANYDNFGANIGGTFLLPNKVEIPPAYDTAPDPMNFNGPVTIGEYVTNCPEFLSWLPNFNYPINIPSNVLNLQGMFNGASSFNQPIKLPISEYANIPNVPMELLTADLSSMFMESAFNQPINNFPLYFNGYSMFENSAFNSPIDFSNSNALSLEGMFYNCQDFNQPVEIPNVRWAEHISDAEDNRLGYIFAECSNFNSPVTFNNSIMTGYINFYSTFENSAFNCPIDFSKIEGNQPQYYWFEDTFTDTPFNQPIVFPYLNVFRYSASSYGSDSISFYDAFGDNFNQPIYIDGDECPRLDRSPQISLDSNNFVPYNFDQSVNISPNICCSRFAGGFRDCEQLNHPVNLPTFIMATSRNWETGEVYNGCSIYELFSGCTNFNQPLIFNFRTGSYYQSYISMFRVMSNCTNFNQSVIFDIGTPFGTLNINAREFFSDCYSFNPNLDLPNSNFLPNYIVDASYMFYNCNSFNVNHISIPLYAENCFCMFAGCNHINHISLYKTNNFNFDNLNLMGFLNGTSTDLKCEIITNGLIDNENYASPMTYEKVLEADLFYRGQISWTNESWGSYNTYYNIYVIQDYNNYVNWTP